MRNYEKIVIDTSIFINPDSFRILGNNSHLALMAFLEAAKNKNTAIFMPPSILEELLNFLNPQALDIKLLSTIIKKAPKKYEILLPSLFFYEFVEESRARINKGLRIAEKYTRYAIAGKKTEEELIKSMRDEYRMALREGIVDSKQDIDLLVLAKEIEAPLLSSDQGLIKWGKKLGIEALILEEVKAALFSTAHSQEPRT